MIDMAEDWDDFWLLFGKYWYLVLLPYDWMRFWDWI